MKSADFEFLLLCKFKTLENNYAFGTVLFVTTTFFLSCISTGAHVAEETEKYFKNKRILLNPEEDITSAILNLRSEIETLEKKT